MDNQILSSLSSHLEQNREKERERELGQFFRRDSGDFVEVSGQIKRWSGGWQQGLLVG